MFVGINRRSGSGLLIIALLGGGCSADTSVLKTATNTLASAPPPVSTSSAQPVEVYALIARGALKCWFGPEGSLKKTHVFHAKVDSPTEGKAAEIAVHTRAEGSSHGVLKAFAVTVTPSGSGSVIETQNYRFPPTEGELMTRDVSRWVTGKDDCSVVGTGGWNAATPSSGTVAAEANGSAEPVAGAKSGTPAPPKQ